VDDHIEGATDSRFRFSTLWTRSPGQLTLPPEFHRVAEAGSVLSQVAYFKVTGGRRIFRMSPLHHHFELGGWSETQTVTRFWLLAALAALLGLLVS